MKKLLDIKMLGVLLALCFFGGSGYAQTPAKSGDGTPVYQDTGNPAIDAVNYQAAKQMWINSQANLKENSAIGVTGDPTLPYGSADNKAAWVNAHPDLYNAALNQSNPLPWGVDENKVAWVAANPRGYAAYVNGPSTTDKVVMTQAELNTWPVAKQNAILHDSHFVIIKSSNK